MGMREVYAASGPGDADLFMIELEEEGIRGYLRNMPLAGSGGELGYIAAVCSIDVPDADFARASAIAARHIKNRQKAAEPDRPCPKCAEANPQTFGVCWSCGAPLELAEEGGG